MDEFSEHRKPLDVHIEGLEERQNSIAAAAGETNWPVHEQRLGLPAQFPNHQAVPCSIYFYYVRINTTGELYVRHYFYPSGNHKDPANPANPADWPPIQNTDADLIPVLQDLIANARAGGVKYPVLGSDFLGIEWRRKSYVALFIDEANWSLHKAASGQPAVLFITSGAGTPNHSFFDGRDLDIPMPQGDLRSAFVCINHMKKDDAGTDLAAGDIEPYQFKMFFEVKFSSGGRPLTVIFDPDGSNEGPPIGPP